jgi:hypothetical protein
MLKEMGIIKEMGTRKRILLEEFKKQNFLSLHYYSKDTKLTA